MKKILYFLIIPFINCACSESICYQVFYNGNLIENRYYEHELLKSIVAYNISNTKDSIIYDGDIKNYHFYDNKYSIDSLFVFKKYYYSSFDQSIQGNHIYRMVKSHVLLEDVFSSLSTIDNELTNGSTTSKKNRIITTDHSNYCIEYNNLNGQFQLYGLFDINDELKDILKSVKVIISDGYLNKLNIVGEKTRKTVIFKYENGSLSKVIINYYYKEEKEPSYSEEYYFKKGKG